MRKGEKIKGTLKITGEKKSQQGKKINAKKNV
jgi:hypothetical protein